MKSKNEIETRNSKLLSENEKIKSQIEALTVKVHTMQSMHDRQLVTIQQLENDLEKKSIQVTDQEKLLKELVATPHHA